MPSKKITTQIQRLEDEVLYWKNKAFEAADVSILGTDTIIDRHENKRGLPKGTRVTFRVKGGELDVFVEKGSLRVDGNIFGIGDMYIQPHVSNSFSVVLIDRKVR